MYRSTVYSVLVIMGTRNILDDGPHTIDCNVYGRNVCSLLSKEKKWEHCS